ncbi:MAG: type II toxin-antitoxin system VapC family toxin [Thermoplasmata archaeon]|nr:type II toxin-antitoxin system VapC family toxin [Thermoplasmata archaeon]
MHCFDTTFLIDYARGEDWAVRKVADLLSAGERLATPAVAAAEVLVGAHYRGGRVLAKTLEFLERLEVLPFEIGEATEAGRLGAEALRRGTPLSGNDLLVAATSRHHRGILVTRDKVFSHVAGLAVEAY